MKQAGIAYATEQIIDLIANGVKAIHLYTMNKPDIAETIVSNLTEILDKRTAAVPAAKENELRNGYQSQRNTALFGIPRKTCR